MWIAVVVAVISALGAIVAAVVAGRFAGRSKEAELNAARVLELERRLSTMKEDVYRPMVELLQSMWDSARSGKQPNEQKLVQTLSTFTTWVQMYGSDHVVIAFHKMMQAVYSDPPANIVMRYIAELTLALRRDIGDPFSNATLLDLLGHRIKDIYDGTFAEVLTLPEPELWTKEDWSPPWGERFSEASG